MPLFGRIAPFYGVFYNYQKRYYGRLLDSLEQQLGLSRYKTVIDIGCGTGALCAAWQDRGFIATGIDPEQNMIDIATRKQSEATFLRADVLKGLPFRDKSFDLAIASYVAHGLQKNEREVMYNEMSRVAKHLVIIHDFNSRRSRLLDAIETLEGGDYFAFIQAAQAEITLAFREVEFIEVGPRAMWYIGKPV